MDDSPAPDRHQPLGALLRRAQDGLQREVQDALAARGFAEIRPAHAVVFRQIGTEGTRLTALADRAGMTKQSMAYLVDGLEAAGHLRSAPDPADGRVRILRLTAKGQRVLAALNDLGTQAEARVAERIGRRRAAKMRRALEEWVEAIEAETPPG